MELSFSRIEAEETYHLRHTVMNPELNITDMYRDGDETALHFGMSISDEKKLIGVISVYPEDEDGKPSRHVWRIRGMAVDTPFQRNGIGKKMIEKVIDKLRKNYDLSKIWCNAREEAAPFYEKLGFIKVAETSLDFPNPSIRYQMVLEF